MTMRIAIDFDGTIVDDSHRYDDLVTPLTFKDGAKDALYALKRARHSLLLWSGRASRSNLYDPRLDPLVRAGVSLRTEKSWAESLALNLARYQQMMQFVETEIPDVFDAVDDGLGGKPSVDLFIDDKAMRLGRGDLGGVDWHQIANEYGDAGGPSPFVSGR